MDNDHTSKCLVTSGSIRVDDDDDVANLQIRESVEPFTTFRKIRDEFSEP